MANDLQSDVDALYGAPLAEFTARRDARVKELKGEGRADDAKAVKALRKPSVSAWAVNQLYRHARAAFHGMLEASKELRAAHEGTGTTRDLQNALRRRQDGLDYLVGRAEMLLQEAGHASGAGTLLKIQRTLEAVAAGAADQPLGQWTTDLEPTGFDALSGVAVGTLAPVPEPGPGASGATEESPAQRQQRDRLAEERERLATRVRVAETEVDRADRRVRTQQAELDKAKDRAEEACKALGEVESELQRLDEALAALGPESG